MSGDPFGTFSAPIARGFKVKRLRSVLPPFLLRSLLCTAVASLVLANTAAQETVDDDNDGMPSSWELFYGFDPRDPTDAIAGGDRDGVSNLDEFLQGTQPRSVSVLPTVETDPVPSGNADDRAIWIHPGSPSQSRVIGADKGTALPVYDLAGDELQLLPDGEMNNVDLRYNFLVDSEPVDIVAASNRTSDSISVYKVDPTTGSLVDVAAGGGGSYRCT